MRLNYKRLCVVLSEDYKIPIAWTSAPDLEHAFRIFKLNAMISSHTLVYMQGTEPFPKCGNHYHGSSYIRLSCLLLLVHTYILNLYKRGGGGNLYPENQSKLVKWIRARYVKRYTVSLLETKSHISTGICVIPAAVLVKSKNRRQIVDHAIQITPSFPAFQRKVPITTKPIGRYPVQRILERLNYARNLCEEYKIGIGTRMFTPRSSGKPLLRQTRMLA